jgi:dihydropteroate synthase
MGIINTTPDSFSGDGLGANPDAAVQRAQRMEREGADWLDIGGESSRPGAPELDPAEEARRVLPAVEAVRAATNLPLSVDTYHPAVAKSAIAAGADAVNDIFGLRRDVEMARVVADAGAVVIAMHNQRGRELANPADVTGAIARGFAATLGFARDHGIGDDIIVLDPGCGFGWTPAQNLRMLRELSRLAHLGYPLLLGTSRKSTIGHVLGERPVEQRLMGTAATVALAIAGGADIVRVHDVADMVDVARMSDASLGRGAPVAVIALGSNLGDRLGNLRAAVRALEATGAVEVARRSSVWETAPVPADQPPFLNAVVAGPTHIGPRELLATLKRIEHDLGRRPERRWGPRPIDLDILFHGDGRIDLPDLQVPHVRILERSFVLAPLAEVLSGRLPVLGVTAIEVLNAIGTEGLSCYGRL